MGHIILLTWKKLLRNKANSFWILLFPVVLGTLFNIAFGNLDASEKMTTIPVAIVLEEDSYGDALKTSVEELSSGSDAMLEASFCNEKEALQLLEQQKIDGILYSGETVSLTISSDMTNESLNQSILGAFVNQYNMYQDSIITIMKEHPEQLAQVMTELNESVEFNKEVSFERGNLQSSYTQYFYNLLAMTCLYAAMGGVMVATENQANLSMLAARKSVSPTHKLVQLTGELIATTSYEFVLNFVGFLYLALILKVDVTARLPFAILAMFIGVLTGVSLGFVIGCFGKQNQEFKQGMTFAVTMPMCFLSGLMVGNMHIIVEDFCPLINDINPAALISDCFYSLALYQNYDRFIKDIISLLILSIGFSLIGFFKTRRQKYASI